MITIPSKLLRRLLDLLDPDGAKLAVVAVGVPVELAGLVTDR